MAHGVVGNDITCRSMIQLSHCSKMGHIVSADVKVACIIYLG